MSDSAARDSAAKDSAVVDVARAALLEITQTENVGDLVQLDTNDEGVSTVLFASVMAGYPDWNWTVSVAQLPGEPPTVLEAELLPGQGSLLAPDWVPWADRLEDYKAAQSAIAAGELAAAGEDDESDDDSDDDDDDSDDDDLEGDDLGDDPDDGIDFESDDALIAAQLAAVSAPVGVDEQDQAEAETEENRPEPPAAPRRQQRRQKKQ